MQRGSLVCRFSRGLTRIILRVFSNSKKSWCLEVVFFVYQVCHMQIFSSEGIWSLMCSFCGNFIHFLSHHITCVTYHKSVLSSKLEPCKFLQLFRPWKIYWLFTRLCQNFAEEVTYITFIIWLQLIASFFFFFFFIFSFHIRRTK